MKNLYSMTINNLTEKKLEDCNYFSDLTELLFQIDLRFEARNIERFRENFRDVDYVKFPTPLQPFVTRTILVETFEVSAEGLQIIKPLTK